MQCVLAVRETVVIKLSGLNIVAQGLSNSLPHSLLLTLYTPLSLKKRDHTASTLNTHRQASLTVSHNTTLVPPLRSCIGPAREAGLSTGTWRGHVPPRKERKKCNELLYVFLSCILVRILPSTCLQCYVVNVTPVILCFCGEFMSTWLASCVRSSWLMNEWCTIAWCWCHMY